VAGLIQKYYDALNDDLNTPILIAQLYETVRLGNLVATGQEKIATTDLALLRKTASLMLFDILGIQDEQNAGSNQLEGVMDLLLHLRQQAKSNKDFATSDQIRDQLAAVGIQIKDGKEGATWSL